MKGIPWFLVWMLVIFGCIGGLIGGSSGHGFLNGFLLFALPPLAMGGGFTAYAFGLGYVIKRLGGDPWAGWYVVAAFLSFGFIIVPLAVRMAQAFGIPVKW